MGDKPGHISDEKGKGKGTGPEADAGDETFQNARTTAIEDFLEAKYPGEFTRAVDPRPQGEGGQR